MFTRYLRMVSLIVAALFAASAAFAQDTVTLGRLTINGGLRFDRYRGLTNGNLLQPRFGVAYRVAQTVFRLSYARLFETPYNENLILANGTGSARNPFGTFRTTPVETGKRNQFNAGIAQKIGTRLLVDADYFATAIENPAQLLVPSIALYEVHKRLSKVLPPQLLEQCLTVMRKGHVIALTDQRAIAASEVAQRHKLAMADSIMYSVAVATPIDVLM